MKTKYQKIKDDDIRKLRMMKAKGDKNEVLEN